MTLKTKAPKMKTPTMKTLYPRKGDYVTLTGVPGEMLGKNRVGLVVKTAHKRTLLTVEIAYGVAVQVGVMNVALYEPPAGYVMVRSAMNGQFVAEPENTSYFNSVSSETYWAS